VLHGFDVDACAVGWDGVHAFAAPRAYRALALQYNFPDLSRRSPTYEWRLYKYAKRGFALALPPSGLDRARVNPKLLSPDMGFSCFTLSHRWHKLSGLRKLILLEDIYHRSQNVHKSYEPTQPRHVPFRYHFDNRPAGGPLPGDTMGLDGTTTMFMSDVAVNSMFNAENFEERLNADGVVFDRYGHPSQSQSDYSNIHLPFGSVWSPNRIRQHLRLIQERRNSWYYRFLVWSIPRAPVRVAAWGTMQEALQGEVCTGEPDRIERRIDEMDGEEVEMQVFKHVGKTDMWRRQDAGAQSTPRDLSTGSFHPLPTSTLEDWCAGVYEGDPIPDAPAPRETPDHLVLAAQ